jgi:hypothetical protein
MLSKIFYGVVQGLIILLICLAYAQSLSQVAIVSV